MEAAASFGKPELPQCQFMKNLTTPGMAPAALLCRSLIGCGWQWLPTWPCFKGSSREHTESGLRRCRLCAEPLARGP